MMTSLRQGRHCQKMLATAHSDFAKRLTTYASYKIYDRMLGDDLVQDTFLKTWKYLVKGGKIDIMKAFLYHILNNLIVDEYRKRKADALYTAALACRNGTRDGAVEEHHGSAGAPRAYQAPCALSCHITRISVTSWVERRLHRYGHHYEVTIIV